MGRKQNYEFLFHIWLWFSAKVGVLQKAVLKYSSCRSKSWKKPCEGCFSRRVAALKPATLSKNCFLHKYFRTVLSGYFRTFQKQF